MHQLRLFCFHLQVLLLCLLLSANVLAAPSPLMLANVYRVGMPLADYWISEKYDGVRAYWDGRRLHTRGGERIEAPSWFTAGWPAQAMDGELWAGRGNFAQAVSTVRMQVPQEQAWRALRFMVFDLPQEPGVFDQRLHALQTLVPALQLPWVQAVAQVKVADHGALQSMLTRVVATGGEGLMLHRGSSLYRAQRSDDLLKFKPHDDSEAVVVGYTPGKGKYVGMVGALLVQMPNGLRFKLGSGLTDAQRRQPPPLGSSVTYRYRGFNASGLPRFAVFMRIREE